MAFAPMDADDCLARLRRGEASAWADFYRTYQGPIYRFAWQMCGLRSISEEVTQETFLAFLKDSSRYDPARGTLGAWLFGIARRQMLRALRDHRRTTELVEEPVQSGWEVSDVPVLRRTVLQLPEPYRAALVLCELQELSYEEAAKILACPVGTVRSRLHRAKRILAARLQVRGNMDAARSIK